MKYRLLKEIPNCDWKVGEIKELNEDKEIPYNKTYDEVKYMYPTEIALLIHCGLLEEVRDEDLKFKIGDNVKIIRTTDKDNEFSHHIGKSGKITDVSRPVWPYKLDLDFGLYKDTTKWWKEEELELVKDDPTMNRFTEMLEEELKEKLWVEVMEDYIKTAEFGHYARDEEEHCKEMRRHLNKLVEFIQSSENTICDHKWEVTLTDKKQFNHCTACNKCEVVIR